MTRCSIDYPLDGSRWLMCDITEVPVMEMIVIGGVLLGLFVALTWWAYRRIMRQVDLDDMGHDAYRHHMFQDLGISELEEKTLRRFREVK